MEEERSVSDPRDKAPPSISEQIAVCIIEQETALEQANYHGAEAEKQRKRAATFGEIIVTLERREQEQ